MGELPSKNKKDNNQKVRGLVERIKKEDKNAFFELMFIFKQEIFEYCYRKLGNIAKGNKQEAEEAAENTFIKAFDNIKKLREADKFKNWLYKIAYNECCNRMNKKGIFIEDISSEDLPLPDKKDNPEEQAMNKEKKKLKTCLNKKLENIVNNLDQKYKEAFILIHYQKLKYKEAAEILDTNENTIKTRTLRALKMVREKIKPYKNLYYEL